MLFAFAKSRHLPAPQETGSAVTEQAIIFGEFGLYGTALQDVR
jgi:hypothetical protein